MKDKTVRIRFAKRDTLIRTFKNYDIKAQFIPSNDENELFVVLIMNDKIIATCEITEEFEVYP